MVFLFGFGNSFFQLFCRKKFYGFQHRSGNFENDELFGIRVEVDLTVTRSYLAFNLISGKDAFDFSVCFFFHFEGVECVLQPRWVSKS